MNQKRTRGFQIEIWFHGTLGKRMLGTVLIYAETEVEALESARNHTRYKVKTAGETHWQVRDPIRSYAKMTTYGY